jgi:plastocyanin
MKQPTVSVRPSNGPDHDQRTRHLRVQNSPLPRFGLRRARATAVALLTLLATTVADGAELRVAMAGAQYRPEAITARVGDVLRFVNDDAVDHVVFVPTRGFGVDFGTQRPGTTTELRLGKPGSFEVECVIHPHMRAQVTVVR